MSNAMHGMHPAANCPSERDVMRIESTIQAPSETKTAIAWYTRPAEALADELRTDLNAGLNVDEAARRRTQEGMVEASAK